MAAFFLYSLSRGGAFPPIQRLAAAPFLLYRKQTADLPPIQRLAAGGDFTLKVSVSVCRLRRPGNAVPTAGAKGGKDTDGFLSPS